MKVRTAPVTCGLGEVTAGLEPVRKTCVRCKLEKPIDSFYRHARAKDGHVGRCKACYEPNHGVCSVKGCKDRARYQEARMCNKHYQRLLRHGSPSAYFPRSVVSRIDDMLDIEGGWWTAAGIALRLDANEDTVNRSLYRLRREGRVESRFVELASGSGPKGGGLDGRNEWRKA